MTALPKYHPQHSEGVRPTVTQRWNAFAYDPFLALGEGRGMRVRRGRLLDAAHGRVLEIGAGTGLNVPHYRNTVTELVLTEPDAGMVGRLRRRLAEAPRRTGGVDPSAATVVAAPADALPVPDASFDVAVTTMVLCTVPDPAAGPEDGGQAARRLSLPVNVNEEAAERWLVDCQRNADRIRTPPG